MDSNLYWLNEAWIAINTNSKVAKYVAEIVDPVEYPYSYQALVAYRLKRKHIK